MIKKFFKWLRLKSVKRQVLRECEREAIKNDFEAELNKQPAKDLKKGIEEINSYINDLIKESDSLNVEAENIAADESMDPKLRYDKAKEVKDQAKEKLNQVDQQKNLIGQYEAGIQQFKKIAVEREKLAAALRVKAEFVRQTY